MPEYNGYIYQNSEEEVQYLTNTRFWYPHHESIEQAYVHPKDSLYELRCTSYAWPRLPQLVYPANRDESGNITTGPPFEFIPITPFRKLDYEWSRNTAVHKAQAFGEFYKSATVPGITLSIHVVLSPPIDSGYDYTCEVLAHGYFLGYRNISQKYNISFPNFCGTELLLEQFSCIEKTLIAMATDMYLRWPRTV